LEVGGPQSLEHGNESQAEIPQPQNQAASTTLGGSNNFVPQVCGSGLARLGE